MELRRWLASKNTKQVSPKLWRELKCKRGCPVGRGLEGRSHRCDQEKQRQELLPLTLLSFLKFLYHCPRSAKSIWEPKSQGSYTASATEVSFLGVTARRIFAQMFSILYYPIGMYMLCGNFPSLQSAPALAPSSLLQQHWSPLSPCGDLLCQSFPSPELWGGSNYTWRVQEQTSGSQPPSPGCLRSLAPGLISVFLGKIKIADTEQKENSE